MRIDIAPHKRPLKKFPHHAPDPHLFHIPSHAPHYFPPRNKEAHVMMIPP
jgi:hypothetical protein